MARRHESVLISLALQIMQGAGRQAINLAVASADVRLALRTLMPYVERHLLEEFWEYASKEHRRATSGPCLDPYERIKNSLKQQGWNVAIEDAPGEGWPMCDRIRLSAGRDQLVDRFGVTASVAREAAGADVDIGPGDGAWAITLDSWDHWQLDRKTWGFPHRIKDVGDRTVPILVTNVRSLERPFWRLVRAGVKTRCLVPASSYREIGTDAVHWFSVTSEPVFAIAAFYTIPPAGGQVFAVLTTEANPLVAEVQPLAMPLILHREDEERWLRSGALDLLTPFPSQLMSVERVAF